MTSGQPALPTIPDIQLHNHFHINEVRYDSIADTQYVLHISFRQRPREGDDLASLPLTRQPRQQPITINISATQIRYQRAERQYNPQTYHTEHHVHPETWPAMSNSPHDSLFNDTTTIPQPNALPPLGKQKQHAYITLLTRATYLAGVVILAHTLKKQGSQYPLIVLYTPSLTQTAIDALELEAKYSNIYIKPCKLLVPPERHVLNVAVDRFTDTWTKLRVFEQFDDGYDAICYLDADMTIHKNMDTIFDKLNELPEGYIAAVHDCVCSPDKMPWTPADHNQENCPLTPQRHPKALIEPMSVKTSARPTYQLFNSGMFLYRPQKQLWDDILHFFNTTDLLGTFKFPDQDFMTHFFRGRWVSVGWQYNAVKTMAYRHENLWRFDEIVCLHYIVDKPWSKRIGADGIAGFKGLDGDTHKLWWEEYHAWFADRQLQGETEIMTIVAKHIARRESEASDDERPDMAAIGKEVHSEIDVVSGTEVVVERERPVDAVLDTVTTYLRLL